MADDTQIQITISAKLDSSLQDTIDAAKEQIAALGESAVSAGGAFGVLGEASGNAQEQANKSAQIARRLSDEIAQDSEQAQLRVIASYKSANDFVLSMGQESLDTWRDNAIAETDAKFEAEREYLQKKAAADQGNIVQEQKDLDQIEALTQEQKNALSAIDQQYAEKKRALDQEQLQDTVKDYQDELREKIAALDAELNAHQITDQQKYDQQVAYISRTKALVDQAYKSALAGMQQESAAYENLKKQETAADRQFAQQSQLADNQLAEQEIQKWTQLGNSIRSSFNSAIDGMLFQGRTFEQGMLTIAQGIVKAFLEMGEKIAEDWIQSQIEALFATKTTQTTAATAQVTTEAGVAAATAYAQWAAFPPLAEAMAADAFANTMAWGSAAGLAVGAWEIPQDMRAVIHKGEMVVPQNFASGLRSGRGLGGGDINMHYGPTINSREPATLSQMLTRESGEMLSWLNRQFRNGAIRAA